MKNTFLAIDLGTGSGRATLGELENGILSLQEINSFTHELFIIDGHGFRNIDLIFKEIKKCLSIIADKDIPVESVGITAWESDFSMMADDVPTPPFISGNSKNDDVVEIFTVRMSAEKIFGQTGVQISQTNSLFQLYALKQMGYEPLKKAKHLLFMPDIFNYLLSGVIQTEFSIAIASQVYNPIKKMWDHDILRTLGVPVAIMPRIAKPGSIIGSISNNISYETGIARVPMVAVSSHSKASAIDSIPATGNNWAFINIGNSCQVGFESATAVITKKSQQLGFTNEGGAGHTFRVLKNLNGLRLLDECRQSWEENNYTLDEMITLAGEASPFAAFIGTDHTSFLNPDDMPTAILEYCRSTHQHVPKTNGEIIRTIIEGLVFKFRLIIEQIELLRGLKPDSIYMTGEGIKNEFLCQLTADCTGIPVIASMDEPTAAGNILVQAMALGIVKNVAEIREITAKSFPSRKYEPADIELWDDGFKTYLQIIN